VTEDERRIVVTALLMRRNGAASPEIVVARTGLGRVEGYSVLARLERKVSLLAALSRACW
jgi:hypothetical protein